jgi:hypothetical protein
MLLGIQGAIVPSHVSHLLGLRPPPALKHLIRPYTALTALGLRPLIQRLLVPPAYLAQVRQLGVPAVGAYSLESANRY